jgi:hypothetical protein
VDSTLIEAWTSVKSFRPMGEKPEDREGVTLVAAAYHLLRMVKLMTAPA